MVERPSPKELDTYHRSTCCPAHSHSSHSVPNSSGLSLAQEGGPGRFSNELYCLSNACLDLCMPPHSQQQSVILTLTIYYLKMWRLQKLCSTIWGCGLSMSTGLRTTALVQATHVFQWFCINSKQVSLFPPSFILIRSHQADRRLFRCALHAKQQDSVLWVLRSCMTWSAYCATSSHLCSTFVPPSTLRSLVSWDTY